MEPAMDNIMICKDCGWMPEAKQKTMDNNIQRTCLLAFITFTVVASLLFVHTSTWDQHSIAIVPAKISETLGIASKQQLIQIADICNDRMLINCEESALVAALKKGPNDLEVIERLAKHKVLTKKSNEAFTLYRAYFALGGKDMKATYNYANLLAENNQYEEAERFYIDLINSKPNVLQLSVNEAYVEMLMKSGNYQKAAQHIELLRSEGAPDYFLNHEYAIINQRLAKKSS